MRLTEFSEFSGYATVRAVSVDKLHAVHLWRYLHCIVAVLSALVIASVVLQWIDVPCCFRCTVAWVSVFPLDTTVSHTKWTNWSMCHFGYVLGCIGWGPNPLWEVVLFGHTHTFPMPTVYILVLDRYCASVSTDSLCYSIGEYDISVCMSPPMPSSRTRRLKHMVHVDRMWLQNEAGISIHVPPCRLRV